MRSKLLVLTVVATLALAACGGGAASPTPQPSPAGPEPTPPATGATDGNLAGSSWVGAKADPSSPADPAKITLAFDAAALSATGGCNRMGGDYKVVDGVLTVGAMFMTEMACDQPLMDQDQWLSTLLNGATVNRDGTTLTLINGDITLTLTDEATANPDASLEDTLWTLNGISDANVASSVPAGVTATIQIQDGRANVAFGCNTGGGEVEISDTAITFGPLNTTLMLCEGPSGEVETVMIGVLQGEVPYTIDGNVLTLTGANGTTLTFTGTQP
jgi:heat shock protein HslJ